MWHCFVKQKLYQEIVSCMTSNTKLAAVSHQPPLIVEITLTQRHINVTHFNVQSPFTQRLMYVKLIIDNGVVQKPGNRPF